MTTKTQTSRYGTMDHLRDESMFKENVEPRIKELLQINVPVDFDNYDRVKSDEKYKRQTQLIEELEKHAFEASSMTGRIVRFQMADSYAVYLVIKVNKTTCVLQNIYIGDEWSDDRIGDKGSLPIDYVYGDICRQDHMNELFR